MPAAAGSFVCSRRSSSVSYSTDVGSALGSARPNATCATRKETHGDGPVLYTGPSGVRNFRSHHPVSDYRMVGIGRTSPEATGDLEYIWRGAPGSPHPTSRVKWAGEIGWLIPPFMDWRNVNGGRQIKMGNFRQAQENKCTHRFQEPWYPAPNHPDYPKMFRQTNYYRTHTANPYIPQPHPSTHTCRPHTVASHTPTRYRSFPSLSDRSSQQHSATGSDRSAIITNQNLTRENVGNSGYDSPNSVHSNPSSTDRQTKMQSYEASTRRESTASSRNSQLSLRRFGLAPSATQTTDYNNASFSSPPGKPDY